MGFNLIMDFNEEEKDRIGKELTLTLASSVESGAISEEQMSGIATHILDKIDTIVTYDQLIAFLTDLSAKWPIFANVLTIEKNKNTTSTEEEKANALKRLEEEIKAEDKLVEEIISQAQTEEVKTDNA